MNTFLFTTTFFEFTGEDVSSMLDYVKGFLDDFTPLLIPIIAVGVGLIIFIAIIRAIRK